jgi:prepilin-type N-terminal cleavage/methylation domain-containing protein
LIQGREYKLVAGIKTVNLQNLQKNLEFVVSVWLCDRRFRKTQNTNIGGFTLIELLVVIIIIGILAAIALPSFMAQTQKARFAEAKSYLGAINRVQQAYYMEKGAFATIINQLSIGITDSSSYTYGIIPGSITGTALPEEPNLIITNSAMPRVNSLQSYISVVTASNATFSTVNCTANLSGTVQPSLSLGSISLGAATCPINFSKE